jgi:catalase
MKFGTCLAAALAGFALSALPVAAFADEPATGEDLVNALQKVGGVHPGKRVAHGKGQCVKGSFVPTAEAAALTKAKHFAGPVGVLGRYSMGGPNPGVSDAQKDAARGFALKFDLGGGSNTDMVMLQAPVFVARNPDDFLALLKAVAPGPEGKPDGEKVGAYFKAHPESTIQGAWLKARPVPASYAAVTYWGVHTFTLVNAKGEKQIIKWKLVPSAGEEGLTDEEAKAKDSNFYTPELTARLAKGPAKFDLIAILGQDGDNLDDPTVIWPEDRKSVKMGALEITGLEDNATCDAGVFDPTNLVEGVEGPENDKIFPMRSEAYAVSYSRRLGN